MTDRRSFLGLFAALLASPLALLKGEKKPITPVAIDPFPTPAYLHGGPGDGRTNPFVTLLYRNGTPTAIVPIVDAYGNYADAYYVQRKIGSRHWDYISPPTLYDIVPDTHRFDNLRGYISQDDTHV